MTDYLMPLVADLPDPNNSGDTKSWFYFYKWNVEGEVHFDIPENRLYAYRGIAPGDRLWFQMQSGALSQDGLVGYVEIIRVETDDMRDVLEIWYDGEHCHKYTYHPDDPPAPLVHMALNQDMVLKWLEHCDVPLHAT